LGKLGGAKAARIDLNQCAGGTARHFCWRGGTMNEAIPVFANPGQRVRLVSVDRPWFWLAEGWRDLAAAPRVGLAYGAVLVAISMTLTLGLAAADLFYLLLPLTAGFGFLAPLLAVGLYETSRRLRAGAPAIHRRLGDDEPATLAAALMAWRRHKTQLAFMGLLLMLFHLAWVRVATLLFALFFDTGPVTLWGMLGLLLSAEGLPFLIVGSAIGAALAALVFAISAVSIPMLLDREVDVITAVVTSFVAVRANWKPMALWAALIAGFTALGMAFFFVGLAVVLPLLGHATWHAYKDIVE
jgi:uncharacterized membrane protein